MNLIKESINLFLLPNLSKIVLHYLDYTDLCKYIVSFRKKNNKKIKYTPFEPSDWQFIKYKSELLPFEKRKTQFLEDWTPIDRKVSYIPIQIGKLELTITEMNPGYIT